MTKEKLRKILEDYPEYQSWQLIGNSYQSFFDKAVSFGYTNKDYTFSERTRKQGDLKEVREQFAENEKKVVETYYLPYVDEVYEYLEKNFPERFDFEPDGIIVYLGDRSFQIGSMQWEMWNIYLKITFDGRFHLCRTLICEREANCNFVHPHSKREGDQLWATRHCLGNEVTFFTYRSMSLFELLFRTITFVEAWITCYNPDDRMSQVPHPQTGTRGDDVQTNYPFQFYGSFDDFDWEVSNVGICVIQNERWHEYLIKNYYGFYVVSWETVLDDKQREMNERHFITFRNKNRYVKIKKEPRAKEYFNARFEEFQRHGIENLLAEYLQDYLTAYPGGHYPESTQSIAVSLSEIPESRVALDSVVQD